MATDIILNDKESLIELIGGNIRLTSKQNTKNPIEFRLSNKSARMRFGNEDSFHNTISIVDKQGRTTLEGAQIITTKVKCKTAKINNLEIGPKVLDEAETGKIVVLGKNGKPAIKLNGESGSLEFGGIEHDRWGNHEAMIYLSDSTSPNPAKKRPARGGSLTDLVLTNRDRVPFNIDYLEVNSMRPVFSHSKKYKNWGLLYNYTNSAMIFQSNGKPVLTADLANKKVGVGTSAPSYTLHVEGEVAGRGGFNSLSDARCKKNVEVITHSLDKIMNLQGVSFNWDENELTGKNPPKEKQLGFIAQDVEKVIPEVVSKDLKGHRSLAYSSIIPLLVEGMKSQQEDILLQNEKIKSQLKENASLHKKIESMESKLNALIDEIREIKND